jgi:acyl-CoA synthetase (AMP-forming)/AMP-acid ligase II
VLSNSQFFFSLFSRNGEVQLMISAIQKPATLVEGLVEGTLRRPSAVTFFPDGKEGIDVADLEELSALRGAALLAQGIQPGAVIGFLAWPGRDFLVNFFAALRIGATVAVLPASNRPAHYDQEVRRLSELIQSGKLRYLLATAPFDELAQRLRAANPVLAVVDSGLASARTALPPVYSNQRAVVVYTAGRSGQPKAVGRSHGDLINGIQVLRGASGLTSEDVLVQWLPLSNPFGLLSLLGQIVYGGVAHVFTPASLHNRPREILRCLADRHATVTVGNNASYEFLCDMMTQHHGDQPDLHRWRVAINAGEPVAARTVERFSRTFAPFGVRRTTMHPMYYVTEAVLAVTCKLPDTVPDVVSVDQGLLHESGKVRLTGVSKERMRSYVSCGVPVSGVDVRIVDEFGIDVGNGVVGEIQISGPAVASGYYRDVKATLRSMRGNWLRTGDRGFLWRGQLFTTGESVPACRG